MVKARVRLSNLVNVRVTKRRTVNVTCGVQSKENCQGCGRGRAMLPCDTKLTKIGSKLWQNGKYYKKLVHAKYTVPFENTIFND